MVKMSAEVKAMSAEDREALLDEVPRRPIIALDRGVAKSLVKEHADHNGINEYLGELYVQTNRIDKANERLEVLKGCNCEEYGELELIIKTRGTKVY